MNVSDTTYELCFDLFMGITSNLEPCCAKQKILVISHRLLNQCLYNYTESNQRMKIHKHARENTHILVLQCFKM